MKLHSILGNSQKLDGGAMFGNAPRALWSRWEVPDEANRIELACRALLVEGLDGKNVLFEAGIGAFFSPDMRERYGVVESGHVLLESLKEAGFAPEDIDVIVLSHLHFDHAGGVLNPFAAGEALSLAFPDASYVVGASHWLRALRPHPRDRASFIPELPGLLEATGRLERVEGEYSQMLGKHVRFHVSDGHTPGLMLAEIRGVMAQGDVHGVVFCADLIPGASWVHVPLTMGYDRNAELLIDEKARFLADMLDRKIALYFTHDTRIAMGTLTRDPKGKFAVGQTWGELKGLEFAV